MTMTLKTRAEPSLRPDTAMRMPIEVDLAEQATLPASVLNSHEVLRGQKVVAISHNGALYRLQTTRQGKLILTK